MKQKILAVLMAMLMIIGVGFSVSAAEAPENLMTGNVGFETGSSASITNWNTAQLGGWKTDISVEHAHTGAQSLLFSMEKENATENVVTMLYRGATQPLEVGKDYVLSAWVRTAEPLQCAGRAAKEYGIQVYARVQGEAGNKYYLSTPVNSTNGDWQKIEKPFKLLAETDKVNFYIRFTEQIYGSIYLDDIQINRAEDVPKDDVKVEKDRGRLISDEPKPDATIVPTPAGAENLFTNGSFEEVLADGAPAGGWAAYGGNWNDMVQVVDGGYDGGKSVRIKTDQGTKNPWLYKENLQVVEGAEYQVSLWVKTVSAEGEGPRIKFEFYAADGSSVMSFQSEAFGKTHGAWHQKSARFKIPAGATQSKMYLRLYGAGEIYYDDVQCHRIGDASRVRFDGDTFYYTEWKTGTVGASLNGGTYQPKGTEVFDIALKDGDTILKSRTGVPAIPEAMFQFDVALLTEIGKEYAVEATLYENEGGAVLEKAKWPVYRFDRPKLMDEEGNIVVNGEVVTPVWGYHVYVADENMKLGKAAGVTIAQGGGGNAENLEQYLDSAHANGMLAAVVLYGGENMYTAGHPTKIQNTIEAVQRLKDHPALFGYIVMDEPYLHLSDPYPELVNAYKTIRSMDPVHPIIIQDTAATRSAKYTSACSDLLLIHEYACNITTIDREDYGMPSSTKIINQMKALMENTHVRPKNIHFLGQTFGEPTREDTKSNKYFLPTIDEAKNMIYQALIGDMEGIGYYCFQSTGWHLKDTPLYAPLVEFGEKELFLLTDAFIMDKGVFFNEDRRGDVWWYAFSMDGALYVMVMNMKNEACDVEIPLKSINNAIHIGDYTATLIGGTELQETVSGNDALHLNMVAHGAALYKVTPSSAVDFSTMEKSFDDMVNHVWADEAVEDLYKKEVVNATGIRTYEPGKNITRADFAMFLIRALNITGDATDVFADVDKNAYYAKEIAIGKAAGILKGVGEDAYSPEAEITRQDMMVIVQRGLAYANRNYEKGEGAELDAFSDKVLVADYAVEALSSMVKSGIIRGNADGTVNPRGNATRAEAAVVMHRIMQ